MPATQPRVCVSGIGMVTPLGISRESTWARIVAGQTGIDRISRFDPTSYDCRVAGEVRDPMPNLRRPLPEGVYPGRFRVVDYAATAIEEALDDAKVEPETYGCDLALVTATHGIRLTIADALREFHDEEPDEAEMQAVTDLQDMALLSRILGHGYSAGGPVLSVATACSAGAMSIIEGARLVQSGRCRAAVVGGADSIVTEGELLTFCGLGVLSTLNEPPQRACRPFDRTRSGFVMGEGACFLVLEREDDVTARGSTGYGYVTGWGASVSAHHLTQSCPDGSAQAAAMAKALDKAERTPAEVDYVNAHGTATPDNDAAETLAIRLALGSHADQTPVSSTKGATGHLIAGAGAVEAAFSLLAMRDGVLPPTLNLTHPDPRCDLDLVPNESREGELQLVMSNSFGLAGSNTSLVLEGVS